MIYRQKPESAKHGKVLANQVFPKGYGVRMVNGMLSGSGVYLRRRQNVVNNAVPVYRKRCAQHARVSA